MTHDQMHPEETQDTALLDAALEAVHHDSPDPETVRRAADRVWQRITDEARSQADAGSTTAAAAEAPEVAEIRGCDDYRALLPAYVAGTLPEARALLLEDHSRECVACRRALIAARSGETAAKAPSHRLAPNRRWLSLAAAAVLLLAASVFGYLLWDGAFAGGTVATVASVDGTLLAVEGGDHTMAPLGGGAVVEAGAPVRTAKSSTAVVRLNDGSMVELAERTQVRVRERRSGTTVFVDRGSIIVEASPQARSRHLFVSTDEALVSVTGTIFSVQHGVKGSRVAVVEGEVRVRQGRQETVLHPGMQVTTRASLTALPVEQQIAWSRNVEDYLGLLSELSALRREIAERVAPAELRFESALPGVVPADTLVYAALPNISGTLAESYQVFQERLASSPILAQWWQEQGAQHQGELERNIELLRDFGSYLGPEVVIAIAADAANAAGEPDGPVFLAAVERPDSFRAFLEEELAERGVEEADLVLVDDPATVEASGDRLLVWLGDGLLIASPEAGRLRQAVDAARNGGSGFPQTRLGRSVQAAYADGTQWLMAADLATLMAREATTDPEIAHTGFTDLDQIVVERWDEGERAVMSADVAFTGERRGIASWLAAPAPMGSLEFVSADAHLAAAFVVKEPTAMLDDLLAMAGDQGEAATRDLAKIEQELGLSLRHDLAAPLGGEVAFAIDGPFLPEPSWKLIVEVYDPATLQHAVVTAVAEANRRLREEAEAGAPGGVRLGSDDAGGRTFYRISLDRPAGTGGDPGEPLAEVHYVFADGYLVVAPSRALLERTLDERAAGATLTSSARFRDLLPRDGEAGFSAVFFQHLGPLLSPLGSAASRLGGGLTAEQQAALAALAADAEPTLAYAYGHPDRIRVAGTGPGGPLGLGVHALTGVGGLATLSQALSAGAALEAAGAAEGGPGF